MNAAVLQRVQQQAASTQSSGDFSGKKRVRGPSNRVGETVFETAGTSRSSGQRRQL
jgi:hypothetical protein